MGIRSLGQEDPLEKKMTTHSSILAWRIPGTKDPGRLQSTGWQRSRQGWVVNNNSMVWGRVTGWAIQQNNKKQLHPFSPAVLRACVHVSVAFNVCACVWNLYSVSSACISVFVTIPCYLPHFPLQSRVHPRGLFCSFRNTSTGVGVRKVPWWEGGKGFPLPQALALSRARPAFLGLWLIFVLQLWAQRSHPPKALSLSLKETWADPPYPLISCAKRTTSLGVWFLPVSPPKCEAEQRASWRSCALAPDTQPWKEDRRPCTISRLNVLYPRRPLEGDPHWCALPAPRPLCRAQTVLSCFREFWPGSMPFRYRFRKTDRKWKLGFSPKMTWNEVFLWKLPLFWGPRGYEEVTWPR